MVPSFLVSGSPVSFLTLSKKKQSRKFFPTLFLQGPGFSHFASLKKSHRSFPSLRSPFLRAVPPRPCLRVGPGCCDAAVLRPREISTSPSRGVALFLGKPSKQHSLVCPFLGGPKKLWLSFGFAFNPEINLSFAEDLTF